MRGSRTIVLGALLAACAPDGPTLHMDFEGQGFYDAPFPSDHRRRGDGTVDLSGYPNPGEVPIVAHTVELLDGRADGFGLTSGVFLRAEAPLDPSSLPTLFESVEPGASILLFALDGPEAGTLLPFTARFEAEPGPFGARNLLSVLPLQGMPLQPGARHALVVTRDVTTATGEPLVPSPQVRALRRGRAPEGLEDDALHTYLAAMDALPGVGLRPRDVAAVAAFTTGDPAAPMLALADHARSLAPEAVSDLALTDLFESFCVYEGRVELPVYQQGTPPYLSSGGAIAFEAGEPVLDRFEEARIVFTIPRAPMPADGWPVTAMIRTGGGGDRPLVDRGVRAEPGGEATPGTGPAVQLTAAGFAGVSMDGPHGGIRNVAGSDEQFLMFNVQNPVALRDNVRQSAAEKALLPELLDGLILDTADCPGAPAQSAFDGEHLALLGHSMGATIAPLTLAGTPRFQAAILSGAGGSYLANVVHKQSPLHVRPLAEVMLGYAAEGRTLHEHDPFLSVLQWAAEPADPPIYGRAIVHEPSSRSHHVLVVQGIVDSYILPPIANPLALSMGLDLAGEALDAGHPELEVYLALPELLPLSGGQQVALPAQGNLVVGAQPVTAVVVQHLEDGVEDGHEVFFQLPGPKRQMRCFLEGLLGGGAPVVPVADEEGC